MPTCLVNVIKCQHGRDTLRNVDNIVDTIRTSPTDRQTAELSTTLTIMDSNDGRNVTVTDNDSNEQFGDTLS